MPFDILTRTAGLAEEALTRLQTLFASVDHRPSSAQWSAIRDLLDHLQEAADGGLKPAVYLSAIPAGTGKSASLASFAQALTRSPAYTSVGMLIAVSRINEARDMAEALRGHRDRVCVITSDSEVNALGAHDTADQAQICISTQAALKATLKAIPTADFEAASRFHYLGRRRAVTCWDESFAFNRPVVLDADTVLGISKSLRSQSEAAALALKRWSLEVDTLPTGLCDVPDFAALGVDFQRLEDAVGERDELVAQVKALAVISGAQGFVTKQGAAAALISHYPELPPSLMPVVVTDASAFVNASYVQMARKIPLRWLKDAGKNYRNLTVRVVPTAASRSVYRDPRGTRGKDLIEMAVRYVESVPSTEDVLVVGYKGHFRMLGVAETKLDHAIVSRLKPEDRRRVRYLTYGHHTATNDHKHVRHVLLLGLNFVPRAAGHAASGAALDLNLLTEHPTEDQVQAQRRGMLMDATLQAILRGNARMGRDGDCGDMEVVIPQTKQTGLSHDDYQEMFPGAQIVTDGVLMPAKPLKGRLTDLAAILARRMAAGELEFPNASLWEELGMQRTNFLALVKKPEWQAYVAALGLRPQRLAGRAMGLRLIA